MKVYIYSPSLHQDLYQLLFTCFSSSLPVHVIPNILNEEHRDVVVDEIVIKKDFQNWSTEIETYESIEGLNHTQEYHYGGIIIPEDLNEKEMNSRVQAMFKQSIHNISSIFIVSQDFSWITKTNYSC